MKVVSTEIEACGSNDIAILGAHSSVDVSLFVTEVSFVVQALHELEPLGPGMRNLKR